MIFYNSLGITRARVSLGGPGAGAGGTKFAPRRQDGFSRLLGDKFASAFECFCPRGAKVCD